MPFTISLLAVVAIPGTQTLWPVDFAALVAKLLDEPNEKAQWGVIADWLDESDNAEHELADAFRWVSKRPGVTVESTNTSKGKRDWWLDGLPRALRGLDLPSDVDRNTIPGLMAAFVQVLRAAREELS